MTQRPAESQVVSLPRTRAHVERLLMNFPVDRATREPAARRAGPHITEMFMLNRRAFVQSLGIGTVGSLSLLETPAAAAAALLQNAPRRAAIPADAIRIGSNENPYGPSPMSVQAVNSTALGANRYPGPAVDRLVTTVAEKFDIPSDHVMLSCGSGDILRAVATTFTSETKAIVGGRRAMPRRGQCRGLLRDHRQRRAADVVRASQEASRQGSL